MIVEFSVFDTNAYTIEHLFDSEENKELIEQFEVGKNAKGLENYLKYVSSDDEENNFSRTYLIKDKTTKEIHWNPCPVHLCSSERQAYRTLLKDGIFPPSARAGAFRTVPCKVQIRRRLHFYVPDSIAVPFDDN